MAKFKVYHAKNWALNSDLHFVDLPGVCEKLLPHWVDGYSPIGLNYVLVAEVETPSMGNVFQLTNHIDYEWWLNDGVTLVDKETRSTSVGDLIECEDGKLFMVAGVGFTEVQWETKEDIKLWNRKVGGEVMCPEDEKDAYFI